MRLKDKVAIVTGGGNGIGRAYALALAAEGAKVVVAEINEDAAKAVAKEIEANGGQALAVKTDVSKEEDTLAMAKKAVERFGRIDVLINNAALFGNLSRKPFYELDLNEWNRVLTVNVTGGLLCARAVFPQMKAQGKGKIVNISSDTMMTGVPNFIHYVTSKAAVVGLTRCLAREVGEFSICVNAVAPGLTMSDAALGRYASQHIDNVVSQQCIKRRTAPEDIVGSVIFLASDDSDMITGQTIAVNGGKAML